MKVIFLVTVGLLFLNICTQTQGEGSNDIASLTAKFQLLIKYGSQLPFGLWEDSIKMRKKMGETNHFRSPKDLSFCLFLEIHHNFDCEVAEDTNNNVNRKYEGEITAMLQKLEKHQLSSGTTNNYNINNISLDWFSGSYAQASPMRMIIVVSSIEGISLNSGIGTYYSSLSDFLVEQGHTVTILFAPTTDHLEISSKLLNQWKTLFQKRAISVVKLDPPTIHVTSPSLTQRSYRIYQYLKKYEREFDVVHFPEWEGAGFFSVVAKHQGIAFSSKIIVVGLHGPWRWVKYGNQQPNMNQIEDLETDWLERKSVELADIVITPSVDLPRWLAAQGWSFPGIGESSRKLYLMPFLPGREINMLQGYGVPTPNQRMEVKELVFFGRLETRKGLVMFADALDILLSRRPNLSDLKITFLGKSSSIGGQASTFYLDQRAWQGGWPFQVNYLTHKDRHGALGYLLEKGRARLAVIPSLADNSPYTIYECLYGRIPFIASDLPSIAALIKPEDREATLFLPSPDAVASKLEDVLSGGVIFARGLVSVENSVASWKSFYDMIFGQLQEILQKSPQKKPFSPKVSVCITYFNRPQFLPMAIQSIREQDYPLSNLEIVVIDDGSTNPDAIEYIQGLKAQFEANNWQIVRTENKYLGAARNAAARLARGEYVLFLDDDNLAKPNQVSTYVSVALATDADLLTAAHDVFRGVGLPDESANTNLISRSVPLGPAVLVGVFKNCFGDANFFMRRQTFLDTGGFTEEKGVGQEDHEFLAKVVLSGLKLEAIPESLLYYRMHDKNEQMMFKTNPLENQVRSARPYASILDSTEETESSNLLKILAEKRVRSLAHVNFRSIESNNCNMTVTGISVSDIEILTGVSISFSAVSIDCPIASIGIGSAQCTNVVTESTTSFQCTTPLIPFPGTYEITVTFEDSTILYTGLDLVVTQLPSPSSSAVISLSFTTDPSLYNANTLLQLLADLVTDTVTSSSQTKRSALAYSDVHDMTFDIVSDSNTLAQVNSVSLFASCDGLGVCQCANPNYALQTCQTLAPCPSDCNGNGECVDGTLGRVCDCYSGFTGTTCNTQTCPNDCSNHGSCLLQAGYTPVCLCQTGWSGYICNITQPCPNNCTGFGTCSSGVCKCISGRAGSDCGTVDDVSDKTDNSKQSSNSVVVLAVVLSVVGVITLTVVVLVVFYVVERRRGRSVR